MKQLPSKTLLLFFLFSVFLGIQKSNSQAAILAILFGDQVASEKFNFSLELGANFSDVSNFEIEKKSSATNFGLGCNFKLSEQLYFSPTVYFLSKRKFGFSSLSLNTGNDNLDNEFAETSGVANLSYIDIPVLFWYEIDKVRVGLGPQVSFLSSSNLVYDGDDGQFTQKIKSETNSIDYGIMAAVGYELGKARKGKGVFIQARYYQGFADMYTDQIASGTNKGSYFSFHVSLPFITDELARKNLEKL